MQAATDKRQYPRADRRDSGELEIAIDGIGRRRVQVVFHSLSCEGGGFMAPAPLASKVASGQRVSVRLDEPAVTLPATIAWASNGTDQWAHGGLRLHLALAPAADRQRYAEWIVAILLRQRQS